MIDWIVDELMKMWQEEGMNEEFNEQLFKNWGNSWASEELPPAQEIKFQENNPFMEEQDNLALAKQLIEVSYCS